MRKGSEQQAERNWHSWSSGEAEAWARRHENTNQNPPSRPAVKGDGLLGDAPALPLRSHPAPALNGGAAHSSHDSPRPPHVRKTQRSKTFNLTTSHDTTISREWTMWMDCGSLLPGSENSVQSAGTKTDISSPDDFLRLWQDLSPGHVDERNIAVFARGSTPTWETTRAHGKWVMLVDKPDTLDRLMKILRAVMTCAHPNFVNICGVLLSIRPTRDCIAIWNTKGGDSAFIKDTRAAIIQAANLHSQQKLNYLIMRINLRTPENDDNETKRKSKMDLSINTNVEGLEALRRAINRARRGPRRSQKWGTPESASPWTPSDKGTSPPLRFAPYGVRAGWTAMEGETLPQDQVPFPKTKLTSCSPLLGMYGENGAFGTNIWAPRGEEIMEEELCALDMDMNVMSHYLEASPSGSSVLTGEPVCSYSSSKFTDPSPAVGMNPKHFVSDEFKSEHLGCCKMEHDCGAAEGGVHVASEGTEAVSGEEFGRGGEIEGVYHDVSEPQCKEGGRAGQEEGNWKGSSMCQDVEEDATGYRLDFGDAVENAMCASPVLSAHDPDMYFNGAVAVPSFGHNDRELSKGMRVKLAMRSMMAQDNLATHGVVGGKESKGRKGERRRGRVVNGRDVVPVAGEEGVTCLHQMLWAMCGAAITVGSSLVVLCVTNEALSLNFVTG